MTTERLIWLLVLLLLATERGFAEGETPTFNKDIAPIFQAHCQECHRPGGTNFGGMIAPMALTTHAEARPWAKSIAQNVKSRAMPPWHADPKFNGQFSNERTLAESEIAAIVRWAEGGAPAGDPALAPPPKEFASTEGWQLGKPDLIVQMPEPYHVPDDAVDIYTAFWVDLSEEMLPNDAYIRAFQCKPGSPIIHHFNAHLLYPVEGKLPPPPEKHESDALAPKGAGLYIGGVASGTEPNQFPDGYGVPLKKGTRVTFDIHYHKQPGPGTGLSDRSEIGFYFTPRPPENKISGVQLLQFKIHIEPGQKEYKLGPVSRRLAEEVDIVSLMPHMHMRGKAARFDVEYPDGASETLLEVPGYDFNWQTVYYYKRMKRIPAGSKITYTAWYDNSPEYGALRGFDAAQEVNYGQSSTDEMMMGFLLTAPAKNAGGAD